jgi:hypothetical protein
VADETVTVPPEHAVRVIQMPFEPSVTRTPGGTILASFGSAGDDADRELDMVLAGVERELATPSTVNVVALNGRIHMSELFEPAHPKTMAMPSPIAWCFHAGAVASVMASPARRRKLHERIQHIARIPIMQSACVLDGPTPAVTAFMQLVREHDVDVRNPDSSQGGLAVLIEVTRPGGEIVCVVAGQPVPRDGAPPPQDGMTEPVITYRSPRLLQVMLDAQARGNATAVIVTELLQRDVPPFVMRFKSGLELRNFGGDRTLPIYADATAVQWAAIDLGKPRESYEPAPVDLRGVLAQCAKTDVGIAVGLYRDRATPMYAVVPAAVVASLVAHLTSGDGSR